MKNISFVKLACCIVLCITFLGCTSQSKSSKDKYITLNDSIKVHYLQAGKGAQTIVFVHGFGCDVNAWKEQTEYFSKNYQTVCIDLPGYGKSDKPHTEYTLDLFAKAVKSVMDTLHIDHTVLVGHSLGTAVCRQVIFLYPGVATALVDVDGVYCFYPADHTQLARYESEIGSFVSSFQGDSVQQNIAAFVQSLYTPKTPQSVKDYALRIMPRTPSYVAYSTMSNLVDKEYWTGEQITVPTLVFAASNSGISTDYREVMQTLYPHMKYYKLDGIGHFIMMEQPQMFNEKLNEFIQK